MKLYVKRDRLMLKLYATDTSKPPLFKLRDEMFRLVHGARSIRRVAGYPGVVELELERTLFMEPQATVELDAKDVAGETNKMHVNGVPIV